MNKTGIIKFFNSTKRSLTKHSPAILTGLGIAGMITTTVLAVKATPKALELINDATIDKVDDQVLNGKEPDEIVNTLTPIETIKAAWKPYIPAMIMGTVSVACIVGGSSVNTKRNAALATAYTLSETALSEYKNKVVETIGEKKEREIRDKIAQDKIENNPPVNREIVITEKGNTLCYDGVSGRYFKSDIENIRKVVNTLNSRLIDEMYVSLNDFYYEIGLKMVDVGDRLGWNVNDGLIDVSYSTQLAEDGTPCLVIEYGVAPRYDYRNLH